MLKTYQPFLKPYYKQLILTLFLGIIGGASSIYLTYLTGVMVNHAQWNQSFGLIIGLFIGILLISVLTQWLIQRLSYHIAYYIVADIRDVAIEHLNHLSIAHIERFAISEIMSRLTNDLDNVSIALYQLLSTICSGGTIVIIALLAMLYLSIPLTLVVLITTPLVFFFMMLVTKHSQTHFQKQQALMAQLIDVVEETFNNQSLVQVFSQEKAQQEKFDVLNQTLYHVGQQAQFISSLTNPLSRFVDHLTYAGIALVGGLLLMHHTGQSDIGLLTSFTLYAGQFATPFINLSGVTSQIQTAIVGLQRIEAFITLPNEMSQKSAHFILHDGKIQFKHTSFSYDDEHQVLAPLDLTIEPKETIALVGDTGAGKSTLMNLLLRFYEPDSGEILLDGTPLEHIPRNELYQIIGIVPQEPWLLNTTIRENLCFGKKDASDEELWQVCQTLKITSLIEHLPHGFNTTIKEAQLSTGERQLLTIARILIRNPRILILDEATSSVDIFTEQRIQHALDIAMSGRTSIVIAHRLSTIQNADHILVMRHGRIVEQGTHQSLLAKNGYYAHIYRSQFE